MMPASGLSEILVNLCKEKNLKLSCAESCTGGLLSASITSVPGASAIFPGSIVSYANEIKIKLLGITPETLKEKGAVSDVCAEQMARGVADLMGSDLAISITGVAGPDGGTEQKPVGTVWFGFFCRGDSWTETMCFSGDRQDIRRQSAEFAMQILINRCIKLGNT